MTVTREQVIEAVTCLGIETKWVASVHLDIHGVTVKRWLTNDEGRVYWDDAFDGAAYEYLSILTV